MLWFNPEDVDKAKEADKPKGRPEPPKPNHSDDCGCEDCLYHKDKE